MHKFILEITDPTDEEMIRLLARKMKWKLSGYQNKDEIPTMNKAFSYLHEITERGNMVALIPDPIAWQKEIRNDKPLDGRSD
jgi:hypothetical protein